MKSFNSGVSGEGWRDGTLRLFSKSMTLNLAAPERKMTATGLTTLDATDAD